MRANTLVTHLTLRAATAMADPGFDFRGSNHGNHGYAGAPCGYPRHRVGPACPGFYHPAYRLNPGKLIDARQNVQRVRYPRGHGLRRPDAP